MLVHYAADHNPDMEFVVNGADVDGSRILWARSMNPKTDHELIKYFRDRRTWLLAGDDDSPTLQSIDGNISARR